MKYLFILIFLCSLCFGTLETDIEISNYDSNYIYNYFSFFIIHPPSNLYLDLPQSNLRYSRRYINDLGHEFPVVSFVCGTYWSGGAWGSKNGFNQYYGNVYFHHCYYRPVYNSYYYYYSYPLYTTKIYNSTVPELSSFMILGSFLFLFRKNLLKSE